MEHIQIYGRHSNSSLLGQLEATIRMSESNRGHDSKTVNWIARMYVVAMMWREETVRE
jgi:hypothetical protein